MPPVQVGRLLLPVPRPPPPLLLLLLLGQSCLVSAGGKCGSGGEEEYRVVVRIEDGNVFNRSRSDAGQCHGYWEILNGGKVALFGCKLPGAPLQFDNGQRNPHAVEGLLGLDACAPVNEATSCKLSQFGDKGHSSDDVSLLPAGQYMFVLQLMGCPYLGETRPPYVAVDSSAAHDAGKCDQSKYGDACKQSVSIRISDAGLSDLGIITNFTTTVTYGDGHLWGHAGTDTDPTCTSSPDNPNCPPKGTQPGMRSRDVLTTLTASFSIPLAAGSSALPPSCQKDPDPRCYFRNPKVCDDVNASSVCVGRCSASCRAALATMNNTDPPGCEPCDEQTLEQYYKGEQGCWQSTCDTDPEYQGGYCGTGTCPEGFFCPELFKCKIPCNYAKSPKNNHLGPDDSNYVHYCPSPIPLPEVPCTSQNPSACGPQCKLATWHGDVLLPIPAVQQTRGTGACPGNRNPDETICPPGSMCDLKGTGRHLCPEGHWCPRGTQTGQAQKCPFWADCPPGTADICGEDLKSIFYSCYIVHGCVFLLIFVVASWFIWRVCSSLKSRSYTKEGEEHQNQLERKAAEAREQHVAKLSVSANPSHRRQASDDGGLLRRTLSDMLSDMEQVAQVGGALIENESSSMTPFGLLQTVDDGFNNGLATIRERWDLQRTAKGDDDGALSKLAGIGSTTPPSRGTAAPGSSLSELLIVGSDSDGPVPVDGETPVGSSSKKAAIDLKFSQLSLILKPPAPPATILRGVTGELKAGRLTAIMGPSGAGKTSFLNVLSGKAGAYGEVGGELLINGRVERDGISKYKRSVGFVPQEDTMLREMTPKEILTFSARMRLPPERKKNEIAQLVDETLDKLNLWKIRHSPVGDEERRGISGGQRKRVNIGMELVAEPSVLFLDEPTSGLDSTSSLEICSILRELAAEQGLNVTAVLHQPRYEIFELFHDVLLLGPGGVTVYLGPAETAISYFESLDPLYRVPQRSNPADFLMDLISGVECGAKSSRVPASSQRAERLAQQWIQRQPENGGSPIEDILSASAMHLELTESTSSEQRTQHGDTPDPSHLEPEREPEPEPHPQPQPQPQPEKLVGERPVQREARSMCAQLQLFFWRGLSQSVRPPSKLIVDYGLIALMGLLIGVVFHNTNIQQLSASNNFTSMAVGFTTIQSSLKLFGNERVVFWREASAGSSRTAYFLGKNLCDLPRLLLVPAFYLALFLGFSGVHDHNKVRYWALFMGVWATSGIGYMASTLFSPRSAQLGGVSLTLVCCLLSGFFPTWPESGKILQTFIQCSYARWLNEALWITDRSAVAYARLEHFTAQRAVYAIKWGLEPGFVCLDPVRGPLPDVACFNLNNYSGTPYAHGCNDDGRDTSVVDPLEDPSRCAYDNCLQTEQQICKAQGFEWAPIGGHTILQITWALMGIGLTSRLMAYALLCGTHRDKQI